MFDGEFYSKAEAYDIAFSYRNIGEQCDFLEWCFKEHSNAENCKELTYIDICSGPAQFAVELAKRKWNSIAVDLSNDMKEYAQTKMIKNNVNIKYIIEDIRNFNSPEKGALAGCYIDSITHLISNEDIISHFRTMKKNMLSGGIYVIELAHPRYLLPNNMDEPNQWTMKESGKEVDILYGLPDDEYETITQIWNLTVRLTLKQNEKVLQHIEKKVKHRFYFFQELKALIELSGVFDFYTFYGDLSLPAQLFDEKSKTMIAVLRFK